MTAAKVDVGEAKSNLRGLYAGFLREDARLAAARAELDAAELDDDEKDALVRDALGGALVDFLGLPGRIASRNESRAAGVEAPGEPLLTSWGGIATCYSGPMSLAPDGGVGWPPFI